ncbi:acetolactate synthase 2 catalytic subunit [Paraferrimonas sedimenticola]|uniref:Acetolactate synthase n=1 Tax=Paraferrimonas sedimenticola TaxID=375674 RepID=A0AA37RU52_9GAMM|nr:acetolactate synthase 2 catalytic subunit [Paraferrimonas sedimenticola]GLP95256.1 acetolactate synthase [Paraferrimonas sedimenticola]
MITGAEAILRVIAAHGVSTVFGYPGGAIMPVYDALHEHPLDHLLCRHEQGAAFAALGYARASGRTGVCLATSGPGATNLVTALADAMMDSIPMVAITGQVPSPFIGTDAFQEMDVLGMSLSCTKHSFLVTEPNELVDTLYQAFELAASGRPGPVLVDVPKDVQQAMIDYKAPLLLADEAPSLEEQKLSEARELLANADKPILYLGGGAVSSGATAAVKAFIKQTGIPSVTTLKGIGCLQPTMPGFLGMLGMHGGKAANLAVQGCDLLVVAGARFDDRVTGKLEEFAPNAKVIHIDIDPAEIDKRRAADVSLIGDLSQALTAIGSKLTISDWQKTCEQLKAEGAVSYPEGYSTDGESIYAPALLKSLADRLSGDSVVSCDVGQHQMWVAQHMWFRRPEDHLSSSGLGTMGFGLPAAIGAQLSRPQAQVVAVSGDGSFMMNVQELTTIKRRKLPVKILLLDNQRLGMVRQWQELFFEARYSETDLSDNPDFVALAAAFDIDGMRIERADQVEQGLNALLNSEHAFILHVCIPEFEQVWPLVPPGAANSQMMEANP